MPKGPLLRGGSQASDPREAVAQLHSVIGGPGTAFAVIFFSPQYDANAIAAAVREHFGDTPVFGCTTAGEITPFGYISGGLCGIGFPADEFAVTSVLFEDLTNFEVASTLERTRLAVANQARTAASAFPDIVGT